MAPRITLDDATLRELWAAGKSIRRISELTHCKLSSVKQALARLNLPPRDDAGRMLDEMPDARPRRSDAPDVIVVEVPRGVTNAGEAQTAPVSLKRAPWQ